METMNGVVFEKVTRSDIDELTLIMKRAFDEDTRRHLGEEAGGPPGYDNGDFIRKYFFGNGANAFKASKDNKLIGAVNVFINRNNENFLGNMFVDSSCQDKGLGSTMWKFIESKYPETKKWRTETPGFSKRNHNFYVNKCGFKVVRIENPGDKYEENYILEKDMRQR